MSYLFVLLTIAFTVYGQLAIKWQVSNAGPMPAPFDQKLWFMAGLLLNPWIVSALAAAFLASMCWMAALTRLPLSFAYPFMSLNFVATILLSAILFAEVLNPAKWVGMGLLVLGIIVCSQKW